MSDRGKVKALFYLNQIDGLGDLVREIQDDLTDGLTVPMFDIANNLREDVRDRVLSQSDGTWAPHSPYTTERYRPHPLLMLTGDMYDSVVARSYPFTAAAVVLNPIAIVHESGRRANWRNFSSGLLPQSRSHRRLRRGQIRQQQRTPNTRGDEMPRREFVGYTEEFFDASAEKILDYLFRKFND